MAGKPVGVVAVSVGVELVVGPVARRRQRPCRASHPVVARRRHLVLVTIEVPALECRQAGPQSPF